LRVKRALRFLLGIGGVWLGLLGLLEAPGSKWFPGGMDFFIPRIGILEVFGQGRERVLFRVHV